MNDVICEIVFVGRNKNFGFGDFVGFVILGFGFCFY